MEERCVISVGSTSETYPTFAHTRPQMCPRCPSLATCGCCVSRTERMSELAVIDSTSRMHGNVHSCWIGHASLQCRALNARQSLANTRLQLHRNHLAVTVIHRNVHSCWIGHASVYVVVDGVAVLFDPVFSERASPFPFAGPWRYATLPVEIHACKCHMLCLSSHIPHCDRLLRFLPMYASPAEELFLPGCTDSHGIVSKAIQSISSSTASSFCCISYPLKGSGARLPDRPRKPTGSRTDTPRSLFRLVLHTGAA